MKISQLVQLIDELKAGVMVGADDQDLSGKKIMDLAEGTDNDIVFGIVSHALTECHLLLNEAVDALSQFLEEDTSSFDSEESDKKELDLASVAELATQLDAHEDPDLQKQASVLDELLMTLAAPADAKEKFELAQEAEINRLRDKYRTQDRERLYQGPKKALDEKIKASEAIKAIKDSIKEYRPLETMLSTRTCPDHPGAQMARVGEATYQCAMDKKVYDFRAGYTSLKGNKIPGGDVSMQSQSLSDGAPNQMPFDDRQSRLNYR